MCKIDVAKCSEWLAGCMDEMVIQCAVRRMLVLGNKLIVVSIGNSALGVSLRRISLIGSCALWDGFSQRTR